MKSTNCCGKRPSLRVAGTKTAEYCAQPAPEGIVEVKSRNCRTEGCGKRPFFGVTGTKTVEYCAQHASDVCSEKCKTRGSGKKLSLGVANTKTTDYCAQHARLQCDVEGYREREVGPHHSVKETIGNVIPVGAKHTTVHPTPTKPSQPSGVIRDSRKRARHPEIMSTASKRAVAGESIAGAVTMLDIDVYVGFSGVRNILPFRLQKQSTLLSGTL